MFLPFEDLHPDIQKMDESFYNEYIKVKDNGNPAYEICTEVFMTPAVTGKGGGKLPSSPQKTGKRVTIAGKSRVVYVGKRGGQYIKQGGQFVRLNKVK
jgi:hypothetical protein